MRRKGRKLEGTNFQTIRINLWKVKELATARGPDLKEAMEGRCWRINGKARTEGYMDKRCQISS